MLQGRWGCGESSRLGLSVTALIWKGRRGLEPSVQMPVWWKMEQRGLLGLPLVTEHRTGGGVGTKLAVFGRAKRLNVSSFRCALWKLTRLLYLLKDCLLHRFQKVSKFLLALGKGLRGCSEEIFCALGVFNSISGLYPQPR